MLHRLRESVLLHVFGAIFILRHNKFIDQYLVSAKPNSQEKELGGSVLKFLRFHNINYLKIKKIAFL